MYSKNVKTSSDVIKMYVFPVLVGVVIGEILAHLFWLLKLQSHGIEVKDIWY